MSTTPDAPHAKATGALLLCRAGPESVGPAARLLRERMLLTRAGPEWSVLVPEGTPWLHGAEPVDRVVSGWATALAVSAPWPVLALWWDADHSGLTLAAGFRRAVGYEWLANGTPVGEDEAMRTFAARLGLDPVFGMRSLDPLTEPAPGADARARLRGLLAVLTRAGLALPAGLGPGEPTGRLLDAARIQPGAEPIEASEWSGWGEWGEWGGWHGWREGGGWRAAVRAELDAIEGAGAGAWAHGPRADVLSAGQLAVGLPLTAWGIRHRSGGWLVAGALLMVHGALRLAYDRLRAFD